MWRIIHGFSPLFFFLLAEFGLYLLILKKIPIDHYAFLWTSIMVGALLLKIFNVRGTNITWGMSRNAHIAGMVKIEKLFPSKFRKQESTIWDDVFEILSYIIMILLNVAIMHYCR